MRDRGQMPARIPIAAARRIAEEYGYDQVVVFARRTGDFGKEWMTTYGVTPQHCKVAAQMAGTLQKFMGWSPTTLNANSESET
jgi:hypothetical protein